MRFGFSALVVVACLSGCTVPDSGDDPELDRAKSLPGVIAVKVRGTQWDVEPRTADDVHVLMAASSKPEDVMVVADAYAADLKRGEVEMLAIVIKGLNRSRLYPAGPISRAMAEDLLAAAGDPNILRYDLGDPYHEHQLNFALADADLPTLAAVGERKRRIKGVMIVFGESGPFSIQWDPLTEDTRLAGARLKFALEMNRHIRLTGAGIGGYVQDPHCAALNLRVAEWDLDAATEYVRAHRTPDVGRIDLVAGAEPEPNPDEASTEVWAPPFPSAKELAAAKDEAERYGATLVTP